jgi:hypothetical protein
MFRFNSDLLKRLLGTSLTLSDNYICIVRIHLLWFYLIDIFIRMCNAIKDKFMLIIWGLSFEEAAAAHI